VAARREPVGAAAVQLRVAAVEARVVVAAEAGGVAARPEAEAGGVAARPEAEAGAVVAAARPEAEEGAVGAAGGGGG